MKTLIKIAWRNVWRNKLRSSVVIGSIAIGIWAGVFVSGFSYGLNEQRTQSTIQNSLSHLQIHHDSWQQENKLEYYVPDAEKLSKYLKESDHISSYGSRLHINGLIASAHYSTGVVITGIIPEQEAALTKLNVKTDSGSYFESEMRNPIIVGEALAAKLKIKPGSKLVLTFTDEDGHVISGAFKVSGHYDAPSSQQEKMQVYVKQEDLQGLLGKKNGVHEFAILLRDQEKLEAFRSDLQDKFPDLLIRTWKDLSPELSFADELMSSMLYIIIGIIMLALCFGIVNTMLMAVLERRKELGMLMGVGMSKTRVFAMIILETLMLAFCGGPLGILLGFISIELTNRTGIDLSLYAEGLESLGIETQIYPSIETSFYFGTAALVIGISLIAAVWPARHALKLRPVDAIRGI